MPACESSFLIIIIVIIIIIIIIISSSLDRLNIFPMFIMYGLLWLLVSSALHSFEHAWREYCNPNIYYTTTDYYHQYTILLIES